MISLIFEILNCPYFFIFIWFFIDLIKTPKIHDPDTIQTLYDLTIQSKFNNTDYNTRYDTQTNQYTSWQPSLAQQMFLLNQQEHNKQFQVI